MTGGTSHCHAYEAYEIVRVVGLTWWRRTEVRPVERFKCRRCQKDTIGFHRDLCSHPQQRPSCHSQHSTGKDSLSQLLRIRVRGSPRGSGTQINLYAKSRPAHLILTFRHARPTSTSACTSFNMLTALSIACVGAPARAVLGSSSPQLRRMQFLWSLFRSSQNRLH